MSKNTKLWALTLAFWLGLVLAAMNLVSKIELFIRLSE